MAHFGAAYGGGGVGADRRIQISSMLKISGIKEVRPNTYYELDAYTNRGENLKILITLPDQFPSLPPRVQLGRQVRHPWVDPNTMDLTGCPSLKPNNWSPHLAFGNVLEGIRTELFNNPPAFLDRPNNGAGGGYQNGSPQIQTQTQTQQPSMQPIPYLPTSFPELENLSTEKLQKLVVDDVMFTDFVTNLPVYRQLDEMLAQLADDNVTLAQRNMTLKPEIDILKQNLAETHTMLRAQKEKYDSLVEQERELAQKFSPRSVESQLEVAEREASQRANELASRFSKGEDTDVDKFCSEFREASKLAHIRKIKLEKLRQLNVKR